MENKILAIDPSGTGTTGVYYRNGEQELFFQFTSQYWQEHKNYIYNLLKDYQPAVVLYETTNYVNCKGKDMTSLFKLLGVLESLPDSLTVPVNQVKGLRSKLLKGEKTIEGISYLPGKGWHYQAKKISTHELDAYLVYWLWQSKAENKPKSQLIGKTIEANKTKPNYKTKDYEKETDDQELLERIEKLEQAIQDIRISCSCVRRKVDSFDDDWPEEPGEHECERECPTSPCVKCGEYGYIEEPEDPFEEEEPEDHD